jgi:hypothetical protein
MLGAGKPVSELDPETLSTLDCATGRLGDRSRHEPVPERRTPPVVGRVVSTQR